MWERLWEKVWNYLKCLKRCVFQCITENGVLWRAKRSEISFKSQLSHPCKRTIYRYYTDIDRDDHEISRFGGLPRELYFPKGLYFPEVRSTEGKYCPEGNIIIIIIIDIYIAHIAEASRRLETGVEMTWDEEKYIMQNNTNIHDINIHRKYQIIAINNTVHVYNAFSAPFP